MEGCNIVVDPLDSSMEIVTLRVPVGVVECAPTLASQLIKMSETQRRHQLLYELREAPLSVLQSAKDSLVPQ